MKKALLFIAVFVLIAIGIITISPEIRGAVNSWNYTLRKVDEATDYDLLRKVEDTCRAMQASYEADLLTWQQYKDSESAEQRAWADQAMMRANKTAASYNQYILENTYLWRDNVPVDIRAALPYIGGE